jgi:hypothetical protein
MARFPTDNREAIETFVNITFPGKCIYHTEERNKYELWDAEVIDDDGKVIALIESKVRQVDDKRFDSFLLDNNKVENLIAEGKRRNIPVYVLCCYLQSKILYVTRLYFPGRDDINITVKEDSFRRNNTDNVKIRKKMAYIPFSDCTIIKNQKLICNNTKVN